jgi:hypothetical protein
MATPPTAAYQSAECLYLICTSGVSDEVDPRDLFKANEIGDYDQDGAPEFIDAWGMPIYFLRWAPGFVSELQTGLDPDPFDPMHIYPSVTGATGQSGYAGFKYQTNPTFALYPLIFSAGPDKQYDIVVPSVMPYSPSIASGAGPPYNVDPFSSLTNASTSNPSDGTPYNASNGGTPLYSFDNIHNHLMGTK